MNIKHYKFLRYLLIILLMITPLRSVMAEQGSHCDMDDMPGMSSTAITSNTMANQMHMSQADNAQVDIDAPQYKQMQHECCCCDGDSCANNCDMGLSISILMQDSAFSPVFVSASYIKLFSSDILARALTPPTRPPLKLS